MCLANILTIAGGRVRFNTREGNVADQPIARNASQSLPVTTNERALKT
jgi:hypothetical protein